MADPLSLVASLVAVATAGLEVFKKIRRLTNAIGNSNEEIRSIGEQVSYSTQAIESMNEFLEDAKGLISIRVSQDALQLVEKVRSIFIEITRMLRFKSYKYGSNLLLAVQWVFTRDKVKPLCAKMESYKLTLNIMVSTMKLAKCKKAIDDG